jgi:hypothetical protein
MWVDGDWCRVARVLMQLQQWRHGRQFAHGVEQAHAAVRRSVCEIIFSQLARMSAGLRPWVIVVIADPSKVARKAPVKAVEGPDATLRRALSLTAVEKVCCVVAGSFMQEWASVYSALRSSNRYSLSADEEPVLEGVKRCLRSIEIQDPKANVIVIPYNHCAVEEASWLDSTKGALRLGSMNRNTVYLLHDNPDNDPRVALQKPQVCTSSVMVGTSTALSALCRGKPAPTIVDLVADSPEETDGSFAKEASIDDSHLNVVHVRLIDEYARLQRNDVWQGPARRVDIQA